MQVKFQALCILVVSNGYYLDTVISGKQTLFVWENYLISWGEKAI